MTTAVTAPIAVRTTDAVRTRAPWSTRAFVEHTMGMAISLHVRALSIDLERRSDEFAAAAERAFAALRRADAVFSTYRADSDLMRVRRGELAEADLLEQGARQAVIKRALKPILDGAQA